MSVAVANQMWGMNNCLAAAKSTKFTKFFNTGIKLFR